MEQVFLVGQQKADGRDWEVQGVFTKRKRAECACRTKWYFVMPCIVDKEEPARTVLATDAYFPRVAKGKAKNHD